MKSRFRLFVSSILLVLLAFMLASCDDGDVDPQAAQGQAIANAISVTGIKLATALPKSRDVAARLLDEPIEVTWVKAGETYDFVVEFTSNAELDFGVGFALALIPYPGPDTADIGFDIGHRIIPLGSSQTEEEHVAAGSSSVRFENIYIPVNFKDERKYLLMAYPNDSGYFIDGEMALKIAPASDISIEGSKLIKLIPVDLRPKTTNDINLISVTVSEDVTSIENNVEDGLKDGYTKLPFTMGEMSLASNNEGDADVDLKAYWITPTGLEIPLYFEDETSGLKQDTLSLTVPPQKINPEYPLSQPEPFRYTSQLYLNQDGWIELLKYAGDLSLGQDAYAATIKYVLQPSPTNQVVEDDTVEVSQNTIQLTNTQHTEQTSEELANQLVGSPAQRSAFDPESTYLTARGVAAKSDPSTTKRDFFELKKGFYMKKGDNGKVSIHVKGSAEGGVDIVPVPTIDMQGEFKTTFFFFEQDIPFIAINAESAASIDLAIAKNQSVSSNFSVENGSAITFKLFGIKIHDAGGLSPVTTTNNAQDPDSVEKAKVQVRKGATLPSLSVGKTFKQEKELFKAKAKVGPIPIRITVDGEVLVPFSIGLAPNNFGVELAMALTNGDDKVSVNVISKAGLDAGIATAGLVIDFIVVETEPKAGTGIALVLDNNQLKSVFFSEGVLPILAIKGKIGLLAEVKLPVPVPCGFIKFCKHFKLRKDFVNTKALVNKRIQLWSVENTLKSIDLEQIVNSVK